MLKLLVEIAIVFLLVKFFLYLTSRSDDPSPSVERTGSKASGGSAVPPGFGRARAAEAEELVEDAHCGVYVPKSAALTDASGRHFCSRDCLEAYGRGER